ncbi:MAG: hypothetical protein J6N49_06845 [Alphaproteobacteria bacterium]|nr:hypothetical protein [Alphaproteobacteria bacterium]
MENFSLISPNARIGEGTIVGRFVIIEDDVEIGKNCHIGDYCRIAKNVVIGDDNYLGARVSVYSHTAIGNRNRIFENSVIGLPSEHIGYHLYQGKVIIGDDNHICSGCTIDCGNNFGSDKKHELLSYITEGIYPEDATVIGNRCFILQGVTIHHNCHIGLGNIPNSIEKDYDTVICCACCLNGFVHVAKGCELSSGTFVREWMAVGPGAFTAMGEHIVKNVPPFAKILKNRNQGVLTDRAKMFGLKPEDVSSVGCFTVPHGSY